MAQIFADSAQKSSFNEFQSIGCDVHLSVVCLFSVPSDGTCNRVGWKLLVEGRIAHIAKLNKITFLLWFG